MSNVQRPTIRCECGREVIVHPTASPWEFTWTCSCGQQRIISHAHAHPPPMFVPQVQRELF